MRSERRCRPTLDSLTFLYEFSHVLYNISFRSTGTCSVVDITGLLFRDHFSATTAAQMLKSITALMLNNDIRLKIP